MTTHALSSPDGVGRERERKMVAHMTALQSSAEELERKIQLKHDESAKRYDLQLEQIREKAALVSRHTSAEDSLKVTPYEKMKWCTMCQVKVRGKRSGEVTAKGKDRVTEGIGAREEGVLMG